MGDLPLNRPPTEPSLKDLLDVAKRDIFLSLNCCHVATIQSYNATLQTATAQVAYKKTYYERNALTGTYDPVLVDYPLLADCPVIFPGGGGFALTFPVAAGDECLVLFNDRDINNWFAGNQGAEVDSPRAHAFADGFILVGPRSKPNVLTGVNGSGAELRTKDGTVKVSVGASKVTITNSAGSLGSILGNLMSQLSSLTSQLSTLCTDIAAITVTCSAPGVASSPPLNAALVTAVGTQITSIGSQLSTINSNLSGLLT